MAKGNGKGEMEEVRKKKCPFLNEWCIEEACSLWTELFQVRNGVRVKASLCYYQANTIILSEINQKTRPPQPQQQKIQLPGL